MRNIRFRAWHKEKKRMMIVDDLNLLSSCVASYDSKNFPQNWTWAYKDIELMQFTGLLDKNGKEIYEGDILKYYLPTLKEWKTGQVKWNKDWSAFWLEGNDWTDMDWVKLQELEVIGNIYENPDLLKDSK